MEEASGHVVRTLREPYGETYVVRNRASYQYHVRKLAILEVDPSVHEDFR